MAHPTRGFRFSGHGINKGIVGDTVHLDAGATLQAMAPTRAHIRLIHCGSIVASVSNGQNLTFTPMEPGAYRVECLLPYEGRERGWIFSNPIFLQ
jgi:hypothetical protein